MDLEELRKVYKSYLDLKQSCRKVLSCPRCASTFVVGVLSEEPRLESTNCEYCSAYRWQAYKKRHRAIPRWRFWDREPSVDELENDLSELSSLVDKLNQKDAEMRWQVEELHTMMHKKLYRVISDVLSLSQKLNENDAELSSLVENLNQKNADLSLLVDKLCERDAETASLIENLNSVSGVDEPVSSQVEKLCDAASLVEKPSEPVETLCRKDAKVSLLLERYITRDHVVRRRPRCCSIM